MIRQQMARAVQIAGGEVLQERYVQHIARSLRTQEDYQLVIPEPEDVDPWQ